MSALLQALNNLLRDAGDDPISSAFDLTENDGRQLLNLTTVAGCIAQTGLQVSVPVFDWNMPQLALPHARTAEGFHATNAGVPYLGLWVCHPLLGEEMPLFLVLWCDGSALVAAIPVQGNSLLHMPEGWPDDAAKAALEERSKGNAAPISYPVDPVDPAGLAEQFEPHLTADEDAELIAPFDSEGAKRELLGYLMRTTANRSDWYRHLYGTDDPQLYDMSAWVRVERALEGDNVKRVYRFAGETQKDEQGRAFGDDGYAGHPLVATVHEGVGAYLVGLQIHMRLPANEHFRKIESNGKIQPVKRPMTLVMDNSPTGAPMPRKVYADAGWVDPGDRGKAAEAETPAPVDDGVEAVAAYAYMMNRGRANEYIRIFGDLMREGMDAASWERVSAAQAGAVERRVYALKGSEGKIRAHVTLQGGTPGAVRFEKLP